jgi:hypothetical protein
VSDALRIAAATSRAGDRLVLTFSGHGARFDDTPAAPVVARPVGARNTSVGDEADGFDESWCLHDGVLLDDDLYRLLARFEPGVWIYLLSDSCYSGTIVRIDDPLRGDRLRGEPEIRATVLLSAGAAEREMCFTTAVRGQFTAAVLAAWDEGRFTGSHLDFHAAVRERSAPGQVPELGRYGIPSDAFERARPFGAR